MTIIPSYEDILPVLSTHPNEAAGYKATVFLITLYEFGPYS